MPPDIDSILRAIRLEARARGSRGRVGSFSTDAASGGSTSVMAGTHGLPMPEARHVADFLALPLDVFLDEAYHALLGREADAAGALHYQRQLLRGALTRIEVLGRLALSPEGRRHPSGVAGVLPAFLLATGYRIPVAGPLAALAARVLGLPAHWQDRSAVERTALATGAWMKRG